MGNNNVKESSSAAAPSSTKRRARPSCPGVPVVVARHGGDALQQLAYVNKPDDAVILEWAPPYTDNGTPVNGYVVERKAGTNGQWLRAHPVDVRETQVALTGLQPGQTYQFRVKASNAMGWSEPGSESELYRVPLDPSDAVRPSFVVGLRDAVVMEHEKVEFLVEVHGIPPPEVEWIVNQSAGAKMIVTERDPDSGESMLVLNNILASDGGEVKCVAVNDVGQATSSAMLTVEAPPRAVLTKKYEDGLIFEDGDMIRLKVEFTGRPRPEVTWYHENKLLTSGDRMEIEISGDFTILKVAQAKRSDRGEYSVKLQSGLGEDSASFLVTVANRPSIPGKPQLVDVTETAVALQWDPSEDDGGCEISCYIVEYNRLGWDMWLKAATTRQPHIRLGDMIAGSTYIFRVKAENPYGVSDPSPASDPVRLPAKSNDTSWIPDVTSSEPVDPDDTTISSSNLGPREVSQQVSRSSEFDYLAVDDPGLEPEATGSSPVGGIGLMSEPPDRPGQVELDPRYAFSASAVLEKMANVSLSQPGATSDVLSGIGSSTSRNSSSPSVSPERPSLEDALSLDDDSSEASINEVVYKPPEVVPEPVVPVIQRGFLLPRSPARLFVHNAVVQSALSSVASSSAPVTLSDVVEQGSEVEPAVLDQIEQDLQNQLDVLEQIESDLGEDPASAQSTVPVLELVRLDDILPGEQGQPVVIEEVVQQLESCLPLDSAGPTEIAQLSEPSSPVDNAGHTDFAQQSDSSSPTESAGPTEIVQLPDQSSPADNAGPTEVVQQPQPSSINNAGPTETVQQPQPSPADNAGPTEIVQQQQPSPADNAGPTELVQLSEPSSPVDKEVVQPSKPTLLNLAGPTEMVQQSEPSSPVDHAGPNEFIHQSECSSPLDNAGSNDTAGPANEICQPVATQLQPATIDSGVCELMANRADGDGQQTDQYSDAYITAVDSISSSDFGDTPEPDGQLASPVATKPTMELDDDEEDGRAQEVDGQPIFLRCVTDQTVKVGSRARFLAEIISSSALQVTWMFDGTPVFLPGEEAHGRLKFLQEGNFYCLEIWPVAVEDEGAWTCRAVLADQSGTEGVSATAQLRVVVPKSYKRPEFVEELQAVLTDEGTVSLECKVVGIPTPVLHWFKDGKEIKAGDVFAFRAPQPDSSAEEAATSLGVYSCQAVNCVGKAVSVSQVRVKSTVKSDGPPVIIEEPFSQKVRVGEEVHFSVRVMVPPLPVHVKWFNKDVAKEASSKYLMGQDGHGGYSLDISPTDIDDDGEWKVAIRNEGIDSESSASAVLTLVVPKNYRPPRFLESLKAVLTEEGLVSFECKVVGFPTPQLQWFKDGQELKPGDVYQLSGTNSLGSYSCVARNCMGTAVSAAELTVDDIQNQLNEEERRQLLDTHRPPVFAQGLRSIETKVGDPLRLSVQVSSTTETFMVTWFHNDEPIELDENIPKFKSWKEEAGLCHLDIDPLEFADEGDWKCIVINDFGHAVTSCSVKLSVPPFFRKPHFLEPLRAVLSDEGTVNLECKVIGVPQPSLKWFKDGVELKPGDIHRIMSGQDGTCCLGTYTCQAHNCMGTSSSSAALLGFEDRPEAEQNAALAQDEMLDRNYLADHPKIARNPSLSTIQEERSSQISLYETANAEDTITAEDREEISVSLDGREVSVSLYETPDLTEEEAQQIVELFAEELSERISYRNTTELPPLRFTRETATSGSLLMEAVVIDVPVELAGQDPSLARSLSETSYEEAPTEADIDELSAMEALIVEEPDQREDPYFLDDLTIPDLPYEVQDVRRSITGLQEALLVQDAGLVETAIRVETFSGAATPVVMTPRQLSIELDAQVVEEEVQILLDGIQSPADIDYYSPLEYSDSCSIPSSSPQPEWPEEEGKATPVVQPLAVERVDTISQGAGQPPSAGTAVESETDRPAGPESVLLTRIENVPELRESADETETSADENSQALPVRPTRLPVVLERRLLQAETAQMEMSQLSSTLTESAICLASDQTLTSGEDVPESVPESRPDRVPVAGQQPEPEIEVMRTECWPEASSTTQSADQMTADILMDENVGPADPAALNSSIDQAQLLDSVQLVGDSNGQIAGPPVQKTAIPERHPAGMVGDSDKESVRPSESDGIAERTMEDVGRHSASHLADAGQSSAGIVDGQAQKDDKQSAITTESIKSESVTSISSVEIPKEPKELTRISKEPEEIKSDQIEDPGRLEQVVEQETDLVELEKQEQDRLLKESEERERLEKEAEAGIQEQDRLNKEAKEKEEQDRLEKEAEEEKDRLQKEAMEQERVKKEAEDKDRLERSRKEAEEKMEQDRLRLEAEEEEMLKKEAEEQQLLIKELERITKEADKLEETKKEADKQDRIIKEAQEQERLIQEAKEGAEQLEQVKLAEEQDRLKKEAQEQDRLKMEEEQARILEETMQKEERERVEKEQDRLKKEAEDKDRLAVEAKEKERIEKEAREKEELEKEAVKLEEDRVRKEAEEQDRLAKEAEEKKRLEKEAEEKDRLRKEAEEKDRLEKEQERMEKEAQEKDRLKKMAEEEERMKKEEEDRMQKEAEEQDRLRKEAEEKDRLIKDRLKKMAEEEERMKKEEEDRIQKEAEEKDRLKKEAEEKERLDKEAEEAERLKKEAQETDRLEKEAEELERVRKEEQDRLDRVRKEAEEAKRVEEEEKLKKEMEEKERLEKEEQDRLAKEAEEKERLRKEAEEQDRLAKEAEEKERLRKEAEEKERLEKEEQDRLAKEAQEKDRLRKEAEEQERIKKEEQDRLAKETEEKDRLRKEAEEKDRLEMEAKERERVAKEEQDRLAKEVEEKERVKKETEEKERLEKEKQDRLAKEAQEKERQDAEAKDRLEKEAKEKLKIETEEMERQEKDRLQKEIEDKEQCVQKEPEAAASQDLEIQPDKDQLSAQQESQPTQQVLEQDRKESKTVALDRHPDPAAQPIQQQQIRHKDDPLPSKDHQLLDRPSLSNEPDLTEDERITKQIEEEKRIRRKEAAEKLLRQQEMEWMAQQPESPPTETDKLDKPDGRHEERLRIEQAQLTQSVEELIRLQKVEEERIQRLADEEEVKLFKQKEEERRIRLEETEKIRKELENQERLRLEEKEKKRMEAERIRKEEEAQERILMEEERIRLEEEIQRLESERIRMKEERRLRQAKEEEEERIRLKKEREEKLKRQQEEEERLRLEEEERMRLYKEERERIRKQKEEEEERMLRQIEERALKKKEENERLRKEQEEEELRKREEERLLREEEDRKRLAEEEKLKKEADEKLKEKEEKRKKMEEEKRKREEEEKRMKEELRKQKEEEALRIQQELQDKERARAQELLDLAGTGTEWKKDEALQDPQELIQAERQESEKMERKEQLADQLKKNEEKEPEEKESKMERELECKELKSEEGKLEEPQVEAKKKKEIKELKELKELKEKQDKEMEELKLKQEKEIKEQQEAEAKAKKLKEEKERKELEEKKLKEEKERKEKEQEEKKQKEMEEKKQKELEEKKQKELEEKKQKELEEKKQKELEEKKQKELKEAEAKKLKEEQERKELEAKKMKEQEEATAKKLKEEQERKEQEEKKLKEENERKEQEEKKLNEVEEKKRKELEEKKLKEERERKEQEENKLKEEKERKELEEKKLKEQQEKERKETEAKKLKEVEEKKIKEQEEKKKKEEAEEKKVKEEKEKKLKEEKEKEKKAKELKEAEEKKSIKEQEAKATLEKEKEKEKKVKDQLKSSGNDNENESQREKIKEKKMKEDEQDAKDVDKLKLKEEKKSKKRREKEGQMTVDQTDNQPDKLIQSTKETDDKEPRRRPKTDQEPSSGQVSSQPDSVRRRPVSQSQDILPSRPSPSTRFSPSSRPSPTLASRFSPSSRPSPTLASRFSPSSRPSPTSHRFSPSSRPSPPSRPSPSPRLDLDNRQFQASLDLVYGTRSHREDVRLQGIRSQSAGIVHSNLDRPGYHPESVAMSIHGARPRPHQLELEPLPESKPVLYEDGRRDPKKKPKFSSKLRDMEVAKGSRIKLTCSLLGSPEPEIEWFRNGFPLLQSEDRQKYLTNWDPMGIASLEIRNLIRADTGEYMCVARNSHGQSSTCADLRVRGDYEPKPSPPTFTSTIRDVFNEDADQLVLDCQVNGFPTPKITWLKDGIKLHLSSRYKQSQDLDGRCRLVVHSPCVGDSGQYACVAQNASWKDEITTFVVVPEHVWQEEKRVRTEQSLAGYPGTAPEFKRRPAADKIVSSGDTVVINVDVSGDPPPEVTWMRNGKLLPPSAKIRASSTSAYEHSLTLHNVTASDLGVYTCRISNGFGATDCRSTLSFDGSRYDGTSAGADDSAHFFQLPESTVTVGRDRDLVIECRVRGHPRPKVTWWKGIRDVAESGRSCIEMDGDLYRFILKKANYGDGGTYIVKASNCHGSQKAYCTVRVKETANSSEWDFKDTETILHDLAERRVRRFNKDVPGPVAAPPTANVSGKNVVSLSWAKPNYTGGAPVLAYKVEAWLLGEGAMWSEVAMTCITSTDVYNLKPEREYLFRITPRNKYGWGESLVSGTPIKTVSRTGLPLFHRQLHPQMKALEHTDVELLCEVTGQPTPEVEWYRDGSKLDGIKQPRYELRSIRSDCRHALTIRDVAMETDDEAKFTCEAVNPAGRVATFTRVLVVTDPRVAEADALFRQQLDRLSGNETTMMAPQFTMRPRDRRVQLTFPVRLTCQVIGFPKPDVTWYHNNNPIIYDERHSCSVDGNFFTLEIATTKFDDAGIYTVQGRNSLGAVGCQCCLVVDGGIRAYVMPFFTHELEDRSVSEGGTFSLIARVEAYPAVGVLWHRDGIRLRPCRQYDMRLDSDGSVALVVSGASSRRHAGVYTCTVTNEMGQVSSSGRVAIKKQSDNTDHDKTVRETTTSLAPRFVQKPRSTEVVEGDSLVVVCEVVGDPKPEVIWLRDWLNPDYYHDADHFVREGDGPIYRLTIPCVKLDFTGAYSVIARNIHGEAKAVISLQVYVHGQGRQPLEAAGTTGHLTTVGRTETAPSIVQPLRHLRCCDGDAVTFECRYNNGLLPEAAGPLQVRWQRAGKLLRLCKDFSTQVIAEEGVARLSIARVYPEDEGEYTCVVYNELGSDSTSACLIVDVADDKENDLMVQLDSRPAGTVSARATPRTTPSRTLRSLSPINSKRALEQPADTASQGQRSRVRKAPPKFYSVPHNKIAEPGETVRFQCNVGGNPSPKVTWDRDNIAIKETGGRIRIEEHDDVRILEIRNVSNEDAGLYRITVENELGRIQANARLDILGRSSSSRSSGFIRSGSAASAGRGNYYSSLGTSTRLTGRSLGISGYLRGSSTPRSAGGRYHNNNMENQEGSNEPVSFIQPLAGRMRVNEGEPVELQVVVSGTPPLKVVWVQNDVPLVDCAEFRHMDHGHGRYGLRLSDPFTHDSGVYFCEAYNRHGEAETWCRLIVTDPTDSEPVAAPSTLAYSSANTASIRTDDEDGLKRSDDGMVEDREDVFINSSKEDLSRDYESDTKLNDELDNPFQVAAQIVKGPVSVSTLVGSTVLLEALVIGRPEPTVRWLKGGKELKESERVEMRQMDGVASLSLHRITADDSGKYIVMAENTFGMDCHYASLAVEGPPDPGGKPTICEVKADSLTLTWYGSVYDGGSVITGYLVEISETGQPWRVLTSECNSTSYVIHGLAPERTYQFRVRAKNIHGNSQPSCPSDPLLLLRPPTATDKRDKAVLVEAKDHVITCHDKEPLVEEDDVDLHAPQFEYCHVKVQPGEPNFLEKYTVHEEVGKGRFGVVYRLVERASGALRAAKYVRCIKAADREKVYQEVAVMNKLRHPKLLQLAAAYDCPKEIILVTEFISGGELFERVVADDFTLTERDCILFMRQICEGVGYMHSKSIVHLDLKPENILCQSPNSHRIKLIDFGLARQLDPDTPVRVLFGTPEFIAPEIVSYEPIGCSTDMWSLGVVCYVLLSGLSPFMGDNDADTFANITSSDYDFDDDAFAAISSDAKDFISSLLVKRPESRLSAEACLQHKWLAQAKQNMNSVKLPTDRLKKFIIRRKWQKTGTAIRALGRMASLSSSRRNSSSSSSGRRSSRMDSLCEEDNGSVFSSNSHSRATSSNLLAPINGDQVTRIRSPSLPVVTHPSQSSSPVITRSRSPSLPAAVAEDPLTPDGNAVQSPRRPYYADRSDSGISDCSNHSSMLLSGSYMPALIQEEEDENCIENGSVLTNGSVRFAGGTSLAQKIDHGGLSGHNAPKSHSVVRSRHSVDSAIGE